LQIFLCGQKIDQSEELRNRFRPALKGLALLQAVAQTTVILQDAKVFAVYAAGRKKDIGC